jgi:hypothetical protein
MGFGAHYLALILIPRHLSPAKTSPVKPERSSRTEGGITMTRMGRHFIYLKLAPPALILRLAWKMYVFSFILLYDYLCLI